MFSFFKKGSVDVPEWASFFSESEYNAFDRGINSYFKDLGIAFSIEDGVVHCEENGFGFNKLGLSNIAQMCKQHTTREYGAIIKSHFDSLSETRQFEQNIEVIINSFEAIKQYIGVRLYNDTYVAGIGKENVIGKKLSGDIFAMIVFDFPDSVTSIKPEQIEPWGKTIDELFEIGKNNIRAQYPIHISKQTVDDFSILFANADHFFTPNIVFDIEQYEGLLGTFGALIGLPHRHSVLLFPIEKLDVTTALQRLIPATYGMCEEGPGSLSKRIFWYYQNTFTDIPYQLENNTLNIYPPDNFLEMLNSLK